MKENELPDNKIIVKLWYAGLGDSYRMITGAFTLSAGASHDSPEKRKYFYVIVGIVIVLMSIPLLTVALLFKNIVWMTALCVIIAFFCIQSGASLLLNNNKLTQAVESGQDTDLGDPYRMKILQKAFKWGVQQGIVVKDNSDNLIFVKK